MRQLALIGFMAAALTAPAFADDAAKPADMSVAPAAKMDTPAKDAMSTAPAEKMDTPANATAAATPAPSKNTLARVEGKDITRADLDAFLATLPPGARALPKPILEPMALDQLINNQLLLKAATADNTAASPEYQKRLADIKNQLMSEIYLRKRIDAQVTDSAMRDEFEKFKKANPSTEEYQARHMLVDDKETAQGLIKQLDAGADFAKLASENNKGPEKAKGGELGYFAASDVVPEFGEALAKLKVGQYTEEPVKTQFGWHVIKLENERKRPAPKFDDVKDQMRQRVTQNLIQVEINKLRDNAKVEVFKDNLTQMPTSGAPTAVDGQKGQ